MVFFLLSEVLSVDKSCLASNFNHLDLKSVRQLVECKHQFVPVLYRSYVFKYHHHQTAFHSIRKNKL